RYFTFLLPAQTQLGYRRLFTMLSAQAHDALATLATSLTERPDLEEAVRGRWRARLRHAVKAQADQELPAEVRKAADLLGGELLGILIWEAGASAVEIPELGKWLWGSKETFQAMIGAAARGTLRGRVLAARCLEVSVCGMPADADPELVGRTLQLLQPLLLH